MRFTGKPGGCCGAGEGTCSFCHSEAAEFRAKPRTPNERPVHVPAAEVLPASTEVLQPAKSAGLDDKSGGFATTNEVRSGGLLWLILMALIPLLA